MFDNMTKGVSTMRRRVNVTLPEETLRLIDRAAKKGDRSRLIDQAVKYLIREKGRINLRQLLKAGALARAERDLRLAEEWFLFEEETERRGKR
jgi:CopG family transcriptional regulator/antitoxin EndoAI